MWALQQNFFYRIFQEILLSGGCLQQEQIGTSNVLQAFGNDFPRREFEYSVALFASGSGEHGFVPEFKHHLHPMDQGDFL